MTESEFIEYVFLRGCVAATKAWGARLTVVERRLVDMPAEIINTNEQRVAILRDAMAAFVGEEFRERDERIETLEAQVAVLQTQNATDVRG